MSENHEVNIIYEAETNRSFVLWMVGNSAGSHDGHYTGGHGSSHKGGHYKNKKTGNHYRDRKHGTPQ